jgi:RNA polymerase sigma-70 factor, ECF subfamily
MFMDSLPGVDEAYCEAAVAAKTKPYAAEWDVQLMCRARDGDVYAFSLLLERHRKPLILFLQRIVQNSFEAEELAQEVFLRVYRARASYQPTAKFTTWLFRIATHTAINWLRDGRHQRFQESLDSKTSKAFLYQCTDRKPTVEETLLATVRVQEIRDAINRLPPAQRTAVILHKYRELDYWQIARELHCSQSAVKSLLYRAYEHLRANLAHFASFTPKSQE